MKEPCHEERHHKYEGLMVFVLAVAIGGFITFCIRVGGG